MNSCELSPPIGPLSASTIDVGEAAAVEDPAIGLVHRVVARVELLDVGVEAVGVLHQELAGPDDAEPRPGLVAELGLDLVEGDRQLLVRAGPGRGPGR